MTAAEVSSVVPCAAFDISTTSLSVLLLDCRIHVWLNHLFIGCNIVGKEKMPVPPPKSPTTSWARLGPVIGMPDQRVFYFGMPNGYNCLVLYWNLKRQRDTV